MLLFTFKGYSKIIKNENGGNRMSLTTVSDVPVNSHIESLKEKHISLSNEIEEAQKNLSTTDFYLSQLKKQKLIVKEKIAAIERKAVG